VLPLLLCVFHVLLQISLRDAAGPIVGGAQVRARATLPSIRTTPNAVLILFFNVHHGSKRMSHAKTKHLHCLTDISNACSLVRESSSEVRQQNLQNWGLLPTLAVSEAALDIRAKGISGREQTQHLNHPSLSSAKHKPDTHGSSIPAKPFHKNIVWDHSISTLWVCCRTCPWQNLCDAVRSSTDPFFHGAAMGPSPAATHRHVLPLGKYTDEASRETEGTRRHDLEKLFVCQYRHQLVHIVIAILYSNDRHPAAFWYQCIFI
jgi:hypothetical protein